MKKFIASFLALIIITMTGCTTGLENNNSDSSSKNESISSSSSSETSSSPVSPSSKNESNITSSSESQKDKTEFTQPLKVHFLDVGQGDSIFIELPNKEAMLIDAGNNVDGNSIVSYIKNNGYNSLNYLIATHPHADHIGGMATVVQSLDINNIYMPRATTTTKTYETLLTTIQSKGLKIKTAKAGVSIINVDNLNIEILAPNSESYQDLNDYSAVIKLTYKDNSFLLTGDAETASENEITANVKADVLKVGHHGSNSSTSNSFLSKVSPNHAVISVGKGNSYGHPTQGTLTKLNNAGINIYRTDEVGTIVFTSDGSKITVDKNASTIKENAPPSSTSINTEISSKEESTNSPANTVTVYVTNTGEKYHTGGCQYLRKSKIAISLDDA